MTELRILEEPLPNLFVIEYPHHPDHRGDFAKLFHIDALREQGIDFTPAEIFYTCSKACVLRGMHFQKGDSAYIKLVTCIRGCVLDVVVDVQRDSKHYNLPFSIELSENSNKALLIGKNYAHGFLALQEECWMLYTTTKVHNPSLDQGVLWSSINFDWPIQDPLLSLRDSQHPPI